MEEKILKTVRLLLLLACLAVVLVFFNIFFVQGFLKRHSKPHVVADSHIINLYNDGKKNFLFLPGYISKDDIRYSKNVDLSDTVILHSANVSTIYINTASGTLDDILSDKDNKEPGTITIVDAKGNTINREKLKYIKGRGNYSWDNWDKKSFKLKLGKKQSLLGLGEGKDFALISNVSDATLIRNDIGRRLEQALFMPYSATGEFADLYINGDYMGNYYLCASIGVGKDRIDIKNIDSTQSKVFSYLNGKALDVYETPSIKGYNIPDAVDDITGGYLVEREFEGRYSLEYGKIKSGFITGGNEHFIVDSPEYCTVSEIKFISDYFEKAEAEILNSSQDSDYEYIDYKSFAKRYLIEELLKNYDGGISSAYYYKDSDENGGLLCAGPGWDYDMSLGNYLDWMKDTHDGPLGMTELYHSENCSPYYKALLNNQKFKDEVYSLFDGAAYDYMLDLADHGIDEYEEYLSASASMDAVRWKNVYDNDGIYVGNPQEYRLLKDFITERCKYLKEQWN
ncbi:MAG: CotH kinase family protein [Butyrivibrio sp.]|nr:CotH kinase family protein [Butyrivibrio sp.]